MHVTHADSLTRSLALYSVKEAPLTPVTLGGQELEKRETERARSMKKEGKAAQWSDDNVVSVWFSQHLLPVSEQFRQELLLSVSTKMTWRLTQWQKVTTQWCVAGIKSLFPGAGVSLTEIQDSTVMKAPECMKHVLSRLHTGNWRDQGFLITGGSMFQFVQYCVHLQLSPLLRKCCNRL